MREADAGGAGGSGGRPSVEPDGNVAAAGAQGGQGGAVGGADGGADGSLAAGGITAGQGGAVEGGTIGTEGTGGRVGNDGSVEAGGMGGIDAGTGGGGGYGGTATVDAAAADGTGPAGGCVCSGGFTTWDCYCQAYDCEKTVTAYASDGGLSYDVMVDWADCNLIEYANVATGVTSLFDRSTGKLVGELRFGSDPDHPNCPFQRLDSITGLQAGVFPGSSCKASECVLTNPASDLCWGVPMAKRDAGPL